MTRIMNKYLIMKNLKQSLLDIKDCYISDKKELIVENTNELNKLNVSDIFNNIHIIYNKFYDYNKKEVKGIYELKFLYNDAILYQEANRNYNSKERFFEKAEYSKIKNKEYIEDKIKNYIKSKENDIEDLKKLIIFEMPKFNTYKFKGYNVIFEAVKPHSYSDFDDGYSIYILEKDGNLFFNKGDVSTKGVIFNHKKIKLFTNFNQIAANKYPRFIRLLEDYEKDIIAVCLNFLDVSFTDETFWTNTKGTYRFLKSGDFESLIKEFSEKYKHAKTKQNYNKQRNTFYIRFEDKVLRISKKWGNVGSCYWEINRKSELFIVGEIYYKDLRVFKI